MTRRRSVLLSLVLAGFIPAVGTQGAVAVPYYTPADFVQGMYRNGHLPKARDFSRAAGALAGAVETQCAAPRAGAAAVLKRTREHWLAAAQAWDALSAVAVGPLLQRRSARQIDFEPTRPALIARALRAAPADLQALERIGTPAKGLPALEWLLWSLPPGSRPASCGYALLLAREIEAEAQALETAFAELAARDWGADPAGATAAMSETLNQWVGGLERLRWAQMEKPLRAAQGTGAAPAYPRAAAGAIRRSWLARWRALSDLAAAPGRAAAPAPGAGLVPLETYLRGRGLNPLADRLARAVHEAERSLQAAQPGNGADTLAAARSLARLTRLAQADIAPALEVPLGFSDSDGD